MKATISFSQNAVQSGGMFNKTATTKYHVSAKVVLSEEERAIVKQAHLGDAVVLAYDVPLKNMDALHVVFDVDKCLSEGIHNAFDTPIKAREFANKLQNETLPNLKGYIEGNRALDASPIELEF